MKFPELSRLPTFELSYDALLHKKVPSPDERPLVFCAVPRGYKTLLWFTYSQQNHVCFVLPLNKQNQISFYHARTAPVCFNPFLAQGHGTLLQGTLFQPTMGQGPQQFTVENVLWYAGFNCQPMPWLEKLRATKELFSVHVQQTAYHNEFLVLGLPVMRTSLNDLQAICVQLPYAIYTIRVVDLLAPQSLGCVLPGGPVAYTPATNTAIFEVRAALEPDIYHLSCRTHPKGHKAEHDCGLAIVPSFQASVELNKLFRAIKENANLDLLEESDDEAEFENTLDDKFVDLDKRVRMRCTFHRKFRKWQPIDLVPMANVSTLAEVQAIEGRKF